MPRGGLEPQRSEQQKSFAERALELFSRELEQEKSCSEVHGKQGKNTFADKSLANLSWSGLLHTRACLTELSTNHRIQMRRIAMNTLPDGDRLLLLPEVAEALRVSDKTVRRLIDEGKLKSLKVRGRILVRSSELMAYVNAAAR